MKNKIIIIIVVICTVIAIYIKFRNPENNIDDMNDINLTNSDVNLNYSEENNEESEKNMNVIEITSENFEEEVMNSEKIVVIDFWAEWCGPCKKLGPIIEEIAEENENLKVGKVNIDNEIELATEYSITAIPTILIIKNGQVVNTLIGANDKEEILEAINNEYDN